MYDQHCYDLAEWFLEEKPQRPDRLHAFAQHIQNAVEEWLAMNTPDPVAKDSAPEGT